MLLLLDILCNLFAPQTWLFWIPLGILIAKAAGSWRNCREFCRTKYSLRERWELAIPSIAIVEIVWLVIWLYGQRYSDYLQMNMLRSEICSRILMIFLTLVPSTAYLVYRFKGCRKFALLICLTQMWVASAVTIVGMISVITHYYHTK